jgi:hypothetical protein
MAHVERRFYPKHMKSEEIPFLAGESQLQTKPNPLTFSEDSDEMGAEVLEESSGGYESIIHQRR